MKQNLLFTLLIAIFVFGCATYKPHTAPLGALSLKGLDSNTTNIFLIGDAGLPDENGTAPKALVEMQKQFAKADQDDYLLFLGDNIYPKGFPAKDKNGHEEAKHSLQVQLDVAKNFPGKVLFIPGNHDWYSGIKGLKRQEKMVEKVLGKNTFQPENGCPIEKIKINDQVVMLVVDSQWYITNWNKHPTINDDCDLKTREAFLEEFRSEIKKARGKTTLVAIHHPMQTSGPHAGHYSFKSHLTPLPVLGTLKNILRTTSGISNADMSNQFYNELRKTLIAASQENDDVIFLSGHEHILGYFESDDLVQIISGSGSKLSPTRVREKQNYSHSTHGYALLNIYKNQSVDVQFVDAVNNTIDFYKQIKAPQTHTPINYPKQFPKTVTASVYSKEETNKSGLFKFLWGQRYRHYYSTPVTVPTVSLDTLFGGLKPIRKGGGNQSKSLRLEDKNGVQYVMRAIRKSATQYIQAFAFSDQYVGGQFDGTSTESLVLDVFTGSHPYAFLTMAPLSDAAGIYHLNPKLYYVPKQNALKQFNNEFGDALYMIEEHASEGHLNLASGKFTGDIISTPDLIKEILSDEDILVDQENYLRARLFDLLVGDWDRHSDQWRWMEFKENGKTIYKTLPRDRDQPFSVMSDGFMLGTAVNLIPSARILRKYAPDLKDVKGFNIEPYPLDMILLNQMQKQDWDKQARHLQNTITDEVIETSMQYLPKEVQDQKFEEIKETLKKRRDNLQAIADRYFDVISRYGIVMATHKDDYILVNARDDGEVEVSVFRKKDNTVKDRFFHYVYQPQKTKEIWIYGLDDEDTFEVKGKSKKIKIRLIGGQNNDEFKVDSGKNIVVYDYKTKKNHLDGAKKARLRLTDDYETNVYNYKRLKNNLNQILPSIGINPDDGLRIGVNNTYTVYGFERNPFTAQHKINASYYVATNGYNLGYSGEFANVVGNLNLGLSANFQSPSFTINYFGYGNETVNNDDDLGLNHNRVKIRSVEVKPELIWNSKRGSVLRFGLSFESIEVDKTPNRFVDVSGNLPNYLFRSNNFGGAFAKFSFANADNTAFPTNGMRFDLETGVKNNFDRDQNFAYLISNLAFVRKLIPSGSLVLASNVKTELNFGDGFEFYQAASIGGTNGLRGFRNQRFTGKNALYQNTDIRYSFSRLKTQVVPIKLGVYGGFDYGRVWIEGTPSKKWHNTFGGGFFVNAVDVLSANLGVFSSDDGLRVAFGLGFGF